MRTMLVFHIPSPSGSHAKPDHTGEGHGHAGRSIWVPHSVTCARISFTDQSSTTPGSVKCPLGKPANDSRSTDHSLSSLFSSCSLFMALVFPPTTITRYGALGSANGGYHCRALTLVLHPG